MWVPRSHMLNVMSRMLLSPRWVLGHALVAAICVLFVNLGFWQVRRLEDRRLENMVVSSRLDASPVQIEELIAGAGTDLESLEFRSVVATGAFDPSEEVLVRSQVHAGTAGWHVITPLVLSDGRAVLVNRGWVPLEMDAVPVPVAPPAGQVTITGWVGLTQERRTGGAVEPEGRLTRIARIDVNRLDDQMPSALVPVYIVANGSGESLPIEVARPDLSDEGPHLMYAIEWFSFAVIGLVGYFFLMRRAARRSPVVGGRAGLGQTLDDGHTGNGPQ
jgi:surfeit locus 1 family protein